MKKYRLKINKSIVLNEKDHITLLYHFAPSSLFKDKHVFCGINLNYSNKVPCVCGNYKGTLKQIRCSKCPFKSVERCTSIFDDVCHELKISRYNFDLQYSGLGVKYKSECTKLYKYFRDGAFDEV
jgi:hypothetical protein